MAKMDAGFDGALSADSISGLDRSSAHFQTLMKQVFSSRNPTQQSCKDPDNTSRWPSARITLRLTYCVIAATPPYPIFSPCEPLDRANRTRPRETSEPRAPTDDVWCMCVSGSGWARDARAGCWASRGRRNPGEGHDPAPHDRSNSECRGTKEAQLSFAFHRRAGSWTRAHGAKEAPSRGPDCSGERDRPRASSPRSGIFATSRQVSGHLKATPH